MIIYGEKWDVVAIDEKSQTADVEISMVEIDGREMDSAAMMAMLGPESHQKLQKELARAKAKVKKYNPTMTQKVGKSKFGGFGEKRYVTKPLMEVLAGDEKAEVRNIRRRHRKGHFADMIRYHGSDNLNDALMKVYSKVMEKPRITMIHGIDPAGCLQVELVRKK